MPGPRNYLGLDSAGNTSEFQAPLSSSGASDSGKLPALDANGRLNMSFMPSGIGADTSPLTATEALAAGDLVNIYDAAGLIRVRKADASNNKPAHGFVLAGVASGTIATVYFEGTNDQLSSLTAGTRFLSATTPGATAAAPPTTAGHLLQRVGVVISSTSINIEIGDPITLA